MKMRFFSNMALLLLLSPLTANAGGIDSLKAFFQNTQSLKAQFHQLVLDSQGRKVQEVDGTVQIQRKTEGPGKFRWDYNKPYVQEIVGDGEKVWLFDPELNQVTVRTIGKALGSSPAALLAGSKELEKEFILKDESRQDGMEWVQVTPKNKESGFETIFLGFKADSLQKMELLDSFGHKTVIEFSKIERNPKLAAQVFQFIVPTGADVVGE
jgi:outer membrane lipoprotein carrier protein